MLALVLVACDGYIEEPSVIQAMDCGGYIEEPSAIHVADCVTDIDDTFYYEQTTNLTPDIVCEPEPALSLFPIPHNTIAIGPFHSLVIIDGHLWAWGFNWYGQLGCRHNRR